MIETKLRLENTVKACDEDMNGKEKWTSEERNNFDKSFFNDKEFEKLIEVKKNNEIIKLETEVINVKGYKTTKNIIAKSKEIENKTKAIIEKEKILSENKINNVLNVEETNNIEREIDILKKEREKLKNEIKELKLEIQNLRNENTNLKQTNKKDNLKYKIYILLLLISIILIILWYRNKINKMKIHMKNKELKRKK